MAEQNQTTTAEDAVMNALAALHGVPRSDWWRVFQKRLAEHRLAVVSIDLLGEDNG